MSRFLEAPSLGDEAARALEETVEARIAARLEDGAFTEREIREIEEMRLRPLPDIQDVQSVYEDHLFRPRD